MFYLGVLIWSKTENSELQQLLFLLISNLFDLQHFLAGTKSFYIEGLAEWSQIYAGTFSMSASGAGLDSSVSLLSGARGVLTAKLNDSRSGKVAFRGSTLSRGWDALRPRLTDWIPDVSSYMTCNDKHILLKQDGGVLSCIVFVHIWQLSWTKSKCFGNSVPKIFASQRITNWYP